ncbi:hypothetical protein KP509_27G007800 [Ceratopteris richardii]|uniref:DUF659 domain-containing protein n=1 Tax=Ceratopteris richardii TaxID=49495 RepID=A0A8T2RFQ3_CERRI|nr:hypothetical protein KP509_27G007800 [Ceratopteris richardii]
MGRSKCIEWEYVVQIKPLGKGQYTCKCKFCSLQWDGGPLRIRAHLLGLIRHGVATCKEVPKEITDRVRKMHLQAKATSSASAIHDRDALGDALIDDVDDSIPTGRSSMGSGESINEQELGSSFVPPTYVELRKSEVIEEVKQVDRDLMGVREQWEKYACTIVSDGCFFLKSVDTSGHVKSGAFIFQHLKKVMLDVGPTNVVQVCIDNAANCIRAGEMVEKEWPTIMFTKCACHCLDLLFEDIGKIVWVANTISQASKDLLKPCATRFAYYFIMLTNLLDERCMQGLRKLLIDDRYMQMKVIVKICTPILKILRLVDREGATMGLIYELTDRMIEQLGNMHDIDQARMKDVMDFCIDRWNMFHTPLHAVGYLLHPIWSGKNQHADLEVNEGWLNYLERYTNGDIVMQGRLIDEFDMYKRGIGMFGRVIAKDESRKQEGVKWWETFGASTPMLQSLALKTKRRNRLLPSHAEKLVYIHTNLRLLSKIKDRGYERMEVTLDMLANEKDDERLLAIQELAESVADENGMPFTDEQPSTSRPSTCTTLDEDEDEDESLHEP